MLLLLQICSTFKDVAASTVYDVLMDADYRSKWDPYMLESFDICALNPNNDVGYYSCLYITYSPSLSHLPSSLSFFLPSIHSFTYTVIILHLLLIHPSISLHPPPIQSIHPPISHYTSPSPSPVSIHPSIYHSLNLSIF